MSILKKDAFSIYFGDKSKSVQLVGDDLKTNIEMVYPDLKEVIDLEHVVFSQQAHGTNGIVISEEYKLQCPIDVPSVQGDIIITDRSKIGIGILTADCLPVIFYDSKKHVLAVAHAGWKGSIAGVSKRAIKMMQDRFKSDPKDIEVYFGPCAKSCCYEVKHDFLEHLEHMNHSHFIEDRKNKLYFDNISLNKQQLLELGIDEANINTEYNHCTMCNEQYCSYRKSDKTPDRQVTIAILKG